MKVQQCSEINNNRTDTTCYNSAAGLIVRLIYTKYSEITSWRVHNSHNCVKSDFTRGIMKG